MSSETQKYHLLTDEELMQHVQSNEVAAFDVLYDRYSQKLLHFFYRRLGNDEEKSQDFLQDLFVKIVERPEMFDRKRKFSTWVYTVAGNMCKNEYRRLDVRRNGATVVKEMNGHDAHILLPQLDRAIDEADFKSELFDMVEELDEVKKHTFLLRYQEHCSIKEISEIMECSEGTVKSRLFYTTKQLAKKLSIYNPKNDSNG